VKKKSIILISIVSIFILLIAIGTFLVFQNTDNKVSKMLKDNTPLIVKDMLKKSIFYIPLKVREYQTTKESNEKLKKQNRKLTFENYYLRNKIDSGKFSERIITTKKNKYKMEEFILPFFVDNQLYDNDKKGYIDVYKDRILVFFGSGKMISIKKHNLKNGTLDYELITNNIISNDIFDTEIKWAGIKDAKVDGDTVYLSMTKKIKENCYKTSLYFSKIKTTDLYFDEIELDNQCANIFSNFDSYPTFKNFNGYQNGGRIVSGENDIFLTVGDYNQWEMPQDESSLFGKIVKISKLNQEFSMISKGHRNQQGMYLVDNKNLIATEHGPKGGDEINLINIYNNKIQNYGWPISSYGSHYDSVPLSKEIKSIAPLYKSHKDYGFVEPVFYFEKSIGISEIIKNYYSNDNSFFVTSLKNKTIYVVNFGEKFKNPKIVEEITIGERIRDIIYDSEEKKYFLFLESSPKLSILSRITN
tara:strand:- start:916 stop:2334 length:1419 start_codon:yes stop_codon:yes gene_type:complete